MTLKTTYDLYFEEEYKVGHIKDGDGETYPHKRNIVSINYRGLSKDGRVIDSSPENEPKKIFISIGQVISVGIIQ